jgi:hypothetical protein
MNGVSMKPASIDEGFHEASKEERIHEAGRPLTSAIPEFSRWQGRWHYAWRYGAAAEIP